MARERISIKGTGKGVIITIGSGNWQAIVDELDEKLSQKASFFKGGRVALNVGNRLLNKDELNQIGALVSQHYMTLWAVNAKAPETKSAAEALGLEVQITGSFPQPAEKHQHDDDNGATPVNTETATIYRTLRSGQKIEHPGNVVIIGDVNPGAEVRAGGNIIVWGRLRGTAHAGAMSENAFVCALKLAPMQLIIGNIISRSPTEDDPDQILPEMAFVQDGQIVAEAWE